MMNLPEFTKVYEALLPTLRETEAVRRRAVWHMFGEMTVWTLIILAGVGWVLRHVGAWLAVVPVILLILILAWLYRRHRWNFAVQFRNDLMGQMSHIIPTLMYYSPTGTIDRYKFDNAQLFPVPTYVYEGEDYCKGYDNGVFIEFAEVFTHHELWWYMVPKYRRMFAGIFFVADFNKFFQGTTVVLPDYIEGRLGAYVADVVHPERRLETTMTRLEDPEFESYFVVYTDNATEARYVLSPTLMKRMRELRENHGAPVYFSFTGSMLHIGLIQRRPMFEPSLFRSMQVQDKIRKFYDDFYKLLELVEELNLNRRIWTKAEGFAFCPKCRLRQPLTIDDCPRCGERMVKNKETK